MILGGGLFVLNKSVFLIRPTAHPGITLTKNTKDIYVARNEFARISLS